MEWDVFVSHASEDKQFVRRLVKELEKGGLKIWFDEFALSVGDSLRRSIDNGLSNSKYGIVVLSHNFFAKEWPQRELDGLLAREDSGEKVILPVWHQITANEIKKYSSILADRFAVSSDCGINSVVKELLHAMGVLTVGETNEIVGIGGTRISRLYLEQQIMKSLEFGGVTTRSIKDHLKSYCIRIDYKDLLPILYELESRDLIILDNVNAKTDRFNSKSLFWSLSPNGRTLVNQFV